MTVLRSPSVSSVWGTLGIGCPSQHLESFHRAGALRDAVRREPTALSLAAAETLGTGFAAAQLPLRDEPLSCCEIAQMKDAG